MRWRVFNCPGSGPLPAARFGFGPGGAAQVQCLAFCRSGTSQIRSAHWINPPWGVFPRLGWSVASFVRPQQRPRAEPGGRRAELPRRALPCLARPPLDPPSQSLALARRPRYALPPQGDSSAAKRLSYKNAAETRILHLESCVYFIKDRSAKGKESLTRCTRARHGNRVV